MRPIYALHLIMHRFNFVIKMFPNRGGSADPRKKSLSKWRTYNYFGA